jgi:large subunit ribosomal protein L23
MNQERIFKVLIGPHISEKASVVGEKYNQYIFKVATTATKFEIKQAVEKLFNVQVLNVTTQNVLGKSKRTARGIGKRVDWKKAIVSVAAGQALDFTVEAGTNKE